MKFSQWMEANETELKSFYREYKDSADYSPDGECLDFRAYCLELFLRSVI